MATWGHVHCTSKNSTAASLTSAGLEVWLGHGCLLQAQCLAHHNQAAAIREGSPLARITVKVVYVATDVV